MQSLIRSRSERWRLAVALGVLLGLSPLGASWAAQISDEAKAQARVKFTEGTEAYDKGEFRQALKHFDGAYKLAPLPGFLFNVAQCHRQLGAFERAAFFYRRYLALSEKEPPNAPMVKELIAEMDTRAKAVALAKAGDKTRPKVEPAKGKDARGAPTQERASLKDAGRRALDIRTSRSMSAGEPLALPPEAVPGAPVPEVKEPLTRKWWVWAGAGAVAVLAGGIVYAVTAPDPRPTTLGTLPGR
ncbi:tetratricopeptide repeat protein [Hyalangium rubrum]|uniref:Tetratricopeptide repeat protein n=1 Tax=Hyalangium rubrum TaxID=3103134 RepID=A0ABU5HGA2_9BACT|nr:tetratricopeptide repeat protein [Hyalangium sp. s54d21]MDY7232192.1 tetratricopeptide repeat protein [Hyalangium sp. s54d21]